MEMKSLIMLKLSLIITLSSVQINANEDPGYTRPLLCRSINWTPFFTKKPYTTLLNSGFCPSWTTRHVISKERQFTHIYLPYGLPFAFLCGACYTGTTNLDKTLNLSHEVNGDAASPYQIQQRPILTVNNDVEHTGNGHQCIMKYGITKSIKNDGQLTCEVRLGKFSYDETATYSVVNIHVTKTEETLEVRDNKVTLTCPKHPEHETNANPLTHVWYEQTSDGQRMVASTNNPTVTFRLDNAGPLVVSCATYHIVTESIAYEVTYTVRKIVTGSWRADPPPSRNNGGNQQSLPGEDNQDNSYHIYGGDQVAANVTTAGRSLNTVMIVIISTTAIILLIIASISLIRCLKNGRRERSEDTNQMY